MSDKHLFIATPAFGNSIVVNYVNSLLGSITHLGQSKIPVSTWIKPGGPYIVQERNLAVRDFLKTKCSHLLFIDADLGWSHDAITKMLSREKPIIGGLYRYKMDEEGYPARIWMDEETKLPVINDDGLIKCDGLPTGFMLIERWVIEEMIKFYPELSGEFNGEPYYNLFDCVYRNNTWWGEDYVFCKRFMGMGGEMWAEPNITFTHCGQAGYTGNWQQYLQQRIKETDNGSNSAKNNRRKQKKRF